MGERGGAGEVTRRWPGVADFAVPAVLAVVQLGGTWLLTEGLDDAGTGGPLTRERWMIAVAAVLCCSVALIWRRTAPLTVLACTAVVGTAGTLAAGHPDVIVGGVADMVALFSVAVHRGRRDAAIGCAAVFLLLTVSFLPQRTDPAVLVTNGLLDAATYVGVTALGQLRRQRKARRREIAGRLAAADRERRDAAAAERERLARDLHDVAGHHLSAVVVHSTAAARIDDPDLTGRALTAAADTGRDVLKALGNLVDVVGPGESADGGLDTLLPPLCQGLARLGVPVSLSVEGSRRLRPQVTNAAYRIVQEALTNAMRYAQGASVTVAIRYEPGALYVTVHNTAPPEEIPAPSLGGGRGIAGMRERAESLGGTLAAGPDEGGWTVHARLPTSATAGRGRGWPEVLDGAAIGVCVALPAALAFAPPDAVLAGWSAGGTALAMLAVLGRALPLWWRRRAPYTALAALTVIDSAWAVLAGRAGSGVLLALLFLGSPAAMIAVSSVGSHARRGVVTWPAPLVAAVPWGIAFAALGTLDPGPPPERPDLIAFGLVTGALFAVLVLLPFWAWGRTVSGRGRRWEHSALESMALRTGEAVLAERHRVAIGLRGTVLEHTHRLVRAAEKGLAGDTQDALTAVADHARAALTDMRALLDALDET
ncbi:sensor histidine kinase [Actinomadura sp. 21ATH]|uniref:sensor histidine kinase n=1 Tax=Actinomadura sp. 21ATH TaxID=1735444 RepID=UPI0035BECF09